MTGTITLLDGGQNYIEFDVACGVIEAVRPAGLKGWINTKILNTKFEVGDILRIDLQWDDYDLPLKYPIVKIEVQELPGSEWLLANMSTEKTLRACPRGGNARMMYEVVFKGMPFYFKCVNKAAIAASDAFRNIDKIPAVLLEDVKAIMLFDEIKPGHPEVMADMAKGYMVIYNNYIVDYGIITHEAAHAWAKDKWGQYAPPEDTDFMKVARLTGEITPAQEAEFFKTSGLITEQAMDALVDTSGDFIGQGVNVGDLVHNKTKNTWANVAEVFSNTDVILTQDIMFAGDNYKIYKAGLEPEIVEKPITTLAGKNYDEDLAESIHYYVFDPAWMKSKCPLRYDIVERMMTDPGYYG